MVTPLRSVYTAWDGARTGRAVLFGSNSMQHGTAVFEGIRCYNSVLGPAAFRLEEHLARLLESARLIGIPHDYDLDRLRGQVLRAAAVSGLADSYVRPVLFTPEPCLGVNLAAFRFTLGVEVWPVPAPADPAGAGVRVTISPWRRPASASFPTRAKATGTYVVSAVARTQAAADGFDDAIQLDPDSGRVAEATIANVFLVRDGRLLTPWLEDSLLAGITRDSVLTLARELGIEAAEGPVEVADLMAADEVFLTGTASELVPVAAVDDREFSPNRPVFHALAAAFRDAVTGRRFGHLGWLTPIPTAAMAPASQSGESR